MKEQPRKPLQNSENFGKLNIPVATIGSFSKLSGYKGRLRLTLEPSLSLDIDLSPGDWVFPIIHKKPVPFQLEWIDNQAPGYLLLKLKGVDSETEAEELLGLEVGLKQGQIEDLELELQEEEQSFEGFSLINQNDIQIGVIEEVIITEFQVLLAVNDLNGVERLIPYHEDLLLSNNTEAKELRMEIPEGLLDL